MPKRFSLIFITIIFFTSCAKKVPITQEPYTPIYPDVEPYVWGSGDYTLQAYNSNIHP